MNRKLLASAMAVGVLGAPVAIAVADENEKSVTDQATAHVGDQNRALVDLKRKAARAEARREAKAERRAKARKRAKKKRERLARVQGSTATVAAASQQQQSAGGGTATPGNLAAIAACESGGNPGAVGGGGAYRGKYQFDQQTWASVGGTGDPAAAPEAEQDRRAAMLYARTGGAAWPNC